LEITEPAAALIMISREARGAGNAPEHGFGREDGKSAQRVHGEF